MIPEFLAIGHVTRDLLDSGTRVGGTVTYAVVTAQRLGKKSAVVSACGPDIDLQDVLHGIEISVSPSPQTTTFRNLYPPQGRMQFIETIALPIPVEAIPEEWQRSSLVLIGPIVHELEEAITDLFPNSFLGLAPQGWLRQWDEGGRVWPRNWHQAAAMVPKAGVTMVSEEDLTGEAASLIPFLEKAPLAIITRGEKGATLLVKGRGWDLPPRPTQPREPTGAGDVFAAAFMIKYQESGDPVLSTQFAQVAASFSIEALGTASIPGRKKVEEWLDSHGPDLGLG